MRVFETKKTGKRDDNDSHGDQRYARWMRGTIAAEFYGMHVPGFINHAFSVLFPSGLHLVFLPVSQNGIHILL